MLLGRHPLNISICHSLSLLLFNDDLHLSPLLNTQLQYLQSIQNKIMLYLIINICISSKTRHVIHLKHPWLQLVIKHYIKAQ